MRQKLKPFDIILKTATQQNVILYNSPTVKARFKFPTKDPSPNLIVDDRTPAQIVSDILRIWCQCLTKSEKKREWNNIAERDLTNTLTLSSGLRIPKTFIDNDIKNFRNLQTAEKMLS